MNITQQVQLLQPECTRRLISPAGAYKYISGMDIYEIRRNNLRVLVEALGDGKQARVAEKLERPANLVSRYLKTKKIGDEMARHIEAVYELQPGCMDSPFEAPAAGETIILYGIPVTKDSVDVAHEIDKLPREMREQVASLVYSMVKHHKLAQRMRKPPLQSEGAGDTPPSQQSLNELTGD